MNSYLKKVMLPSNQEGLRTVNASLDTKSNSVKKQYLYKIISVLILLLGNTRIEL